MQPNIDDTSSIQLIPPNDNQHNEHILYFERQRILQCITELTQVLCIIITRVTSLSSVIASYWQIMALIDHKGNLIRSYLNQSSLKPATFKCYSRSRRFVRSCCGTEVSCYHTIIHLDDDTLKSVISNVNERAADS